ncbi:hypothetical protein [Gemmiger sp.]
MKVLPRIVLGLMASVVTGITILLASTPGMIVKRKYEGYNGTKNKSEHVLQTITLPVYNNIQIVSVKEACAIKSGVLVLAYPQCPFCRNLMPELLHAATETDAKLYYCEFDKYRDVYTYNSDTDSLIQTVPAQEGYFEFLEWVRPYTYEYVVKSDSGEEISVGEQRISVPTLLYIQDNHPVSSWALSSVQNITYPSDGYEPWNEETRNQIYDSIYQYLATQK